MKKKLKSFLTIVGWVIIAFALIALVRFIAVSGVFK
jgi:hypothetical protein